MNLDCLNLDCIDCRRPLTEATDQPEFDRVRCACGLRYSCQLINLADRELWARARDERLFRRDGDTIWMTTPFKAIRGWP